MTKFLIGGFILLIEIPLLGASLGPGLTSIVLSVILGISILMLMGKTLGGKLASYPQSSTTALVLFYLFIALQVISYLRATLDAQIETKEVIVDIILVISICAAALACYSRKDSFNSDFPYLVFHSIGIYVVVDAILFVLGIGVDTSDLYADTPLLLKLIGMETPRTAFPMSLGLNFCGITGGASLIAGFAFLNRENSSRLIRWALFSIYASAGIYTLAYTDTRSAMLFSFILIVASYFPRLLALSKPLILVPVTFLLPLVYIGMDILPSDFVTFFSRESTGLLSSRDVIWGFSTSNLADFNLLHFIGYGTRGQVAAGISNQFSFIFDDSNGNSDSANAHTLHNISLQTIYDTGYIGLAVFVALVCASMLAYYKNDKKRNQAFYFPVILVTYFLAAGATEAVPSIFAFDSFSAFLFLIFWMIVRRGNSSART